MELICRIQQGKCAGERDIPHSPSLPPAKPCAAAPPPPPPPIHTQTPCIVTPFQRLTYGASPSSPNSCRCRRLRALPVSCSSACCKFGEKAAEMGRVRDRGSGERGGNNKSCQDPALVLAASRGELTLSLALCGVCPLLLPDGEAASTFALGLGVRLALGLACGGNEGCKVCVQSGGGRCRLWGSPAEGTNGASYAGGGDGLGGEPGGQLRILAPGLASTSPPPS